MTRPSPSLLGQEPFEVLDILGRRSAPRPRCCPPRGATFAADQHADAPTEPERLKIVSAGR
jgi:hypothetical protein